VAIVKCDLALKNLDDYVEGRLDAPLRVVLDHHFSECESCQEELTGARDMANLFKELPVIEPPSGFRSQTLARIEAESPRGVFGSVGRLRFLPAKGSRTFAGAALAVLAAGLLFTRTQFSGAPTNGVNPAIEWPGGHHLSVGQPEMMVSSASQGPARVGDEITLQLILQPAADLSNARMAITGMSEGLVCETSASSSDRGQLLWNGSVPGGSALPVKLQVRAVQPNLQYVLIQVESDFQNYQRKIFIPVYQGDPPSPVSELSGNLSASEALKQIAQQFGVIVATDLSHQRKMATDLRLTRPELCVKEFAGKRGMQFVLRGGVYNVYSNDVPITAPRK
jgi:hypothetical protein